MTLIQKISKIGAVLYMLIIGAVVFLPALAAAQTTTTPPITYTGGALVQCGNGVNGGIVSDPATAGGVPVGEQSCGFPQLMQLISRIIDFLLFLVAPIIAAGIILWSGILVLTAAGSTENISKAKGMFTKAVIGLVIALSAWLIVKFIFVSLGYDTTLFPTFY